MHILSTGLGDANRHEEALHVQGADMANRRRVKPRCIDSEPRIMNASASSMHSLGRHDEALKIYRFIYNIKVKRFGDDESTFITLEILLGLALPMCGGGQAALVGREPGASA